MRATPPSPGQPRHHVTRPDGPTERRRSGHSPSSSGSAIRPGASSTSASPRRCMPQLWNMSRREERPPGRGRDGPAGPGRPRTAPLGRTSGGTPPGRPPTLARRPAPTVRRSGRRAAARAVRPERPARGRRGRVRGQAAPSSAGPPGGGSSPHGTRAGWPWMRHGRIPFYRVRERATAWACWRSGRSCLSSGLLSRSIAEPKHDRCRHPHPLNCGFSRAKPGGCHRYSALRVTGGPRCDQHGERAVAGRGRPPLPSPS